MLRCLFLPFTALFFVAKLLGVDGAALKRAMLNRNMSTKGSFYSIQLKLPEVCATDPGVISREPYY